ncbi:MAG: MMPL family transporter [Flavobacteriales bacterium]
MGLLFKSIKVIPVTLVPNILPLVLVAGIMGFTGTNLKISTSIIFTIGFGIAVDDTIHFMSRLKLEQMKGRSLPIAMKRTFFSTGRAIILTSIILCSGFIGLIFSDFLGTYYIGTLVTMVLLFALISDLYLLPVLFIKAFKNDYHVNKR